VFVVDTNILLYGADRDSPEHNKCRNLIQELRRQPTPWYVTWGIIYEFLRVATHPNVFRKPFKISEAWKFVEALFASPGLGILSETERHQGIAEEVMKSLPHISGNLVFDLHTAVLMKEHGIKTIYTRDADFHRFSFIEVVDPLQTTN